ncbi:MAG: MiaB/RimO family radical SAM methylthiotransferase [Acidobacteriota bacterium]
MMRFAVLTLGCKLNQYDSAKVAARLARAGAVPSSPESAELILVNTCTVTHKADRDSRKAVRSLKRANPGARLAVFGCASRRTPAAFSGLAGVDAVLSDDESLLRFLDDWRPGASASAPCVPLFPDRTRAFLKVQEGCNQPCSYCIVPSVRGPSRSVPPEEVEAEFAGLLEAGFREVVLTGINTGEYGKDLGWKGGLTALLERLLRRNGDFRLRLNSVEPRTVTPGLVRLLRAEGRLARHLQVPLQSGSDAVLAAMRRNYKAGFFADLLQRLAEEVPGIGLGCDVLCGFPSETREDHEATLRLLEGSPVAFLHAFAYSPRPGTPAASIPPLPPGEVAARTRELVALGRSKSEAFARSQMGRPLEALTLASESGRGRALTSNFLDVLLDGAAPPNRWITVRLTRWEGGLPRGEILEERDLRTGSRGRV